MPAGRRLASGHTPETEPRAEPPRVPGRVGASVPEYTIRPGVISTPTQAKEG